MHWPARLLAFALLEVPALYLAHIARVHADAKVETNRGNGACLA